MDGVLVCCLLKVNAEGRRIINMTVITDAMEMKDKNKEMAFDRHLRKFSFIRSKWEVYFLVI